MNDDVMKLENDLSEDYWFKPPKIEEITIFFKYHPIQISITNFNSEKLYKRKDKTCRKWVTYSKSQKLFFCSICLAFHRQLENNFCKGVIDFKHMYQKLEEHERSKTHSAAVESFIIQSKNADIKTLLCTKNVNLHKKQILDRRAVLHRIIDILKLIGKRGLSFRGSIESAYTLENENVDHGNFLEILMLFSKYDLTLKNHLNQTIELSKKRHDKVGSSRGRGDLISFFSKTTLNYIIDSIRELIISRIADEVNEVKIFTIQIDTTQDINVTDQCSVIIRCVF